MERKRAIAKAIKPGRYESIRRYPAAIFAHGIHGKHATEFVPANLFRWLRIGLIAFLHLMMKRDHSTFLQLPARRVKQMVPTLNHLE